MTVPYDELLTVRLLDILVVEDNRINQLIVQKMLEGVRHRVEVVSNGQEACSLVAEKNFDIIIMDIHMPIMDGLEATKAIRLTGILTPIIGCTADSFPDEVSNFRALGMDDIVIKPVHFHSLLASINAVLGEDIHSHSDGRKLMVPPVLNFT